MGISGTSFSDEESALMAGMLTTGSPLSLAMAAVSGGDTFATQFGWMANISLSNAINLITQWKWKA